MDDLRQENLRASAQVCHEVNRAYCQSIGDDSQPPWDKAPAWQQSSAIAGAAFALDNPDATPSDSHQSWLATKRADGWTWGQKKDPDRKLHPCMVPYEKLPPEQRTKDALFLATVRAVHRILVAYNITPLDPDNVAAVDHWLRNIDAQGCLVAARGPDGRLHFRVFGNAWTVGDSAIAALEIQSMVLERVDGGEGDDG